MKNYFRLYTSSDYPVLEAMIFGLYDDMKGEPMSAAKIANTVKKLTESQNRGCIYIFENQDDITGYAILIYFWSNEYGGEILNIDELFIKKEYRRQGIAREFFQFLENEFKNKVVAFALETTQENHTAYKFYRQSGFEEYRNTVLFKQFKLNQEE
ncbi:MAG: GNAT family N-acetyltransferase [Scytonematopsis contorta HA4267-MV1]|jgi:GNAT superfamily N-acetyltransferase|nr:GNAT family N-acetyltransferase [Scytonematopsis contorta HA4267-MV1]